MSEKAVTVERLIRVHNRVSDHSDYLNSKIPSPCSEMTPISIGFTTAQSTGSDVRSLGRLDQITIDSLDPKMEEALLQSLDNLRRVLLKRARLDDIQRHYQISGLKRCFSELGRGRLEHWEPLGELCFLDEDIVKIGQDCSRIVQFWIDHVEMSRLSVFRETRWGEWEPTTIEYVTERMKAALSNSCCASTWEVAEDHSSNPRRLPRVSRCLFLDIGRLDSEEVESFLATNDHI